MLNEIDNGRKVTLSQIEADWSPLEWKFDLGGVEHTLRGHSSDSAGNKSKFSEQFSQAGKIARLFKEVRGNIYLATQKDKQLPRESAFYEQNGSLCLVLPAAWLSETLQSMGMYKTIAGIPRPYRFFRFVVGRTEGKYYLASTYPVETDRALGTIRYYSRSK